MSDAVPDPSGPTPASAPAPAAPSAPAPHGGDEAAAKEGGLRGKVRRRRRVLTWLMILGPGLIAANAGNDAGGIATHSSAGAQFGYRPLFIMVLVTVALVVVQEMSARLGAFTGEGLMSLIREQFPLRAAAFAIVCLLVANLGLVVSEFAGIGAAFELFGVSRYLSIPIAAVVIWALVALGDYRWAERVFLTLGLVFVAYPIAAVMARPDWGEVGANLVLPHFVADRQFLFLAVALIGTTVTPYMQLYQAAAVADRGAGPEGYRLVRIDSIVGSIFAGVVVMSIIVATGAAIGGTGPLDSAEQAAQALRPVAGAGAEVLFGIGLLGASALAAAVVPLSTSYAVAEAAGVERSVSRTFREAPLFLGMFTGLIVVGASVALLPGNLIQLLLNMQVLNGIISPVVLTFLLILANRRSVLGDAANGPRFRIVATTCVVVIAILAVAVLGQTVLGWFGLV
jgi:Mn2+/Fe2+ NRAMP family transporter